MSKKWVISYQMDNFKNFFISNIVVVVFVIITVLMSNYYFVSVFSVSKEIYFVLILGLVVAGSAIYIVLSRSIFEDMQKSNNAIDFLIKQTLHELNTPVSSIMANIVMLKKNENDQKKLQRLERIDFAAMRLQELYEAMEYELKSKIGKTSKEIFDLKESVSKTILKHKEINKTINLSSNVKNAMLNCDIFGFQRMLDNLVSNAIKYNKNDGFVKIELTGTVLKIQDSGIGIDTKNLFAIFEAYFQEDSKQKGFGIGLAIVKDFCDKNKIKISIDSNENGTTFELELKNIIQT